MLAPIALLELLSQLGTRDAESAFAAVHALPRLHNPQRCDVLPWSDDFFRLCLFKMPPEKDVMIQSLNNAIVRVLNATSAIELKSDGDEMRAMMDVGKQQALSDFATLRDKTIFAQSIARKAGIAPESVDVDAIVSNLAAHYTFEQQRIAKAAMNPEYNLAKRVNDAYDSELLVYLADPSLHLLTCDTGFNRAKEAIQGGRIHLAKPDELRTSEGALKVLESIIGASAAAPS